ncbi:hypothetical protein [Pseudosporangium ferrugineum]|uniref:Phage-related protein n=1 Tax=Pseudosporangium ferrugineum TaxID=439699 RepID=A0A2T0RS71_9ACTN|nr:hypothetical protein [Pseudosporangium ferrugineum]PRY24049.1 hypothetical protein CLV70_114182 [Pseudosporangium ferrugineum]
MTSPTSVGQISVEIVAELKGLAKSIRKGLEKSFQDLDFSKAIQDAAGTKPIKVKVEPEFDTSVLPEKVKRTRVPKVPVELDPVLAAFQQEVRRQTAALSRQAIKIPVDGDTAGLRAGLAAQLASIKAQSRIEIPTEPGEKAAYETRLRAQLAEVAHRVKQTVTVNVDVDTGRGASALTGVGAALRGFSKALPNIAGVSSAVADLGGALQKAAGNSAQLGGNLVGAFTTAAGPIGAIVGFLAVATAGMAALGGAAVVAAGAVSAVAGAAASVPGAIAGGLAAFGALKLGFSGISETLGAAFKPKAGGGSAGEDPASRARRIAAAERGVESARRGIAAATRGVQAAERGYDDAVRRVSEAQRRAKQAQEAVNKARREAREDIEDLNRALAGARLDEEDAALRVTEALRALNEAKETGVLPDIQRADLEYRQAQQALEEAKDSTEDLGEASADANRKGVEGSDKVRDALEDQRQAFQAVKDAQAGVLDAQNAIIAANDGLKSSYDSLASAQDSLAEANKKAASAGGGGLASQLPKLAPSAQAFVDAIKRLKPAFDDLRLDVQQRLFAGLDTVITTLAGRWKKPLGRIFGSYADTFNGFFKNLGKSLGKPKFIQDIETGAEGFRKGLDKILDAVSGPLVEAFGTLSAASAPFLEALGDEIADVVTKFSEWVAAGEKSGALQDFFTAATEAMHQIFRIGGSVVSIIGSIITIITGRRHVGKDKSALEGFADGLQKVSDWLDDPAHQEGIRQFFESIVDGIQKAARWVKKIDGWIDKLNAFMTAIRELFGGREGNATGAGKGAADALTGVGRILGSKSGKKTTSSPGLGNLRQAGDDAGSDFGEGLLEGLKRSIGKVGDNIPGLFWEGPDSLVGRIKAGLGIASPSTVMAAIGDDLINGLIKGIGDGLAGLKRKAGEMVAKVREGVGTVTGTLAQKGRDLVSGLVKGLGERYPTAKNTAVGLKNIVTAQFTNSGSTLTSAGKNVGASLANGIAAMYPATNRTAKGLKTQVQSPWDRPGQILYNVGQIVAQGLQQGIDSQKRNLGYYLTSLATYIKSKKGPISKDRVMLRPEGQAIMSGLIDGIASRKEALGAELAGVTSLVTDTSFPGLGADLDAAVSSNLAIAGAHTFVLDFAPGFTGDFLVDGLKKNIKARNNGNVVAALGS